MGDVTLADTKDKGDSGGEAAAELPPTPAVAAPPLSSASRSVSPAGVSLVAGVAAAALATGVKGRGAPGSPVALSSAVAERRGVTATGAVSSLSTRRGEELVVPAWLCTAAGPGGGGGGPGVNSSGAATRKPPCSSPDSDELDAASAGSA
jgi:hypothetical protein